MQAASGAGTARQRPVVAVGALGGTIAMTPGERGVAPTLGAADLVAAVPGLDAVATVRTSTLAAVPGASLQPSDLVAALRWAEREVEHGAVGVVLTQGTDTLEESAFLVDLWWDRPEPVVVTGAMRPPHHAGADGPANLLAAAVTAAAPVARGLGALVVMQDEVHAAGSVQKAHSTSPGAFVSPDGSLGRVVEGALVLRRLPVAERPAPVGPPERPARVALIEATLGDDGALLRLVAEAGYDAVVVAGHGAGHLSADAAAAVSEVLPRMPVVLASRTGAGTVLAGTYGFPGSERDLLDRGALSAGWLHPRAARGLSWAVLSSGGDRELLRAELGRRGGSGDP